MTTMSLDPTIPFAIARYREGAGVRVGLVVGDRIRPIESELGAGGLNGFLAHHDWDRLATAAASAAASAALRAASSAARASSSALRAASSSARNWA